MRWAPILFKGDIKKMLAWDVRASLTYVEPPCPCPTNRVVMGWLVTQLDDPCIHLWISVWIIIFLTSSERRNIVQLCTSDGLTWGAPAGPWPRPPARLVSKRRQREKHGNRNAWNSGWWKWGNVHPLFCLILVWKWKSESDVRLEQIGKTVMIRC